MYLNKICSNFKQTLIALSQLMFCFIGSILSIFNSKITVYADLTTSSQAYRLEQKGLWYGKIMRVCIDFLFLPFGKEHCKLSYESDLKKHHLPN